MSDDARPSAAAGGSSHSVRLGLKWVSLSLGLSRLVRFGTTALLTWFLARELFGLVTIANAVINVLASLREMGFGQAYIQRRDADEEDARRAADTTFALSLGTNLVLMGLAYLLVPAMGRVFHDAEGIETVLRVMLLAFLIDPFSSTPAFVLQKRLDFRRISISEIWASFANAGVAIVLAFAGAGVWSLVAGQLGSRVLQGAVLWRAARWRPRLSWSPPIARELFGYGKYLWGFSALSAVGGVLDRLVIGRVIGVASAGVYGLAFNLCNLPATQVAFLVNRIAFPAMARVQGDRAALRASFQKALSHVCALSFPLSLGLFAVAPDLVRSIYSPDFESAIPVVEVLAFYGLLLSAGAVCGPLLKAVGKPQVLLYTSVVHHAILFPALFLLARHGVVGIAVAVLLPLIGSTAIGFVLVARHLRLSADELLGPLLRTGLSAAAMCALVVHLRVYVLGPALGSPRPALLVSVVVGALAYVLFTALFHRRLLREFRATLREVAAAKGR